MNDEIDENIDYAIIDDNEIKNSFVALLIKDEHHAMSLAADILCGLIRVSTEFRGGDIHKEMKLISCSGRIITISGKKNNETIM